MKKIFLILLASIGFCLPLPAPPLPQTNRINGTYVIYGSNSWLNLNSTLNMGRFKVTNMLAGTAPLDAVNFSQLTNSIATNAGNVYTYSNNFFNPLWTNTFNGPVILQSTNFLRISGDFFGNATNFFYNNAAGTFKSDRNGTNLYYKGSLKVFPLDDGGNRGYLFPRGTGYTIVGPTNDVNNSAIGDFTWCSLAATNDTVFGVEGRIAAIRGSLSGSTAGDRGGQMIFQVKTNASSGNGPFTKMTLNDIGELRGSTDFLNIPMITNWNANLLSLKMLSEINMSGFKITNMLAGTSALDAVNLSQLQAATNTSIYAQLYLANIFSNTTAGASSTNDDRGVILFGTNTLQQGVLAANGFSYFGISNTAAANLTNYPVTIRANSVGNEALRLISPNGLYTNNITLNGVNAITTMGVGAAFTHNVGFYSSLSAANFISYSLGATIGTGLNTGIGASDSSQSFGIFAYGSGTQKGNIASFQTNALITLGSTNTVFTGMSVDRTADKFYGFWSTNVTINPGLLIAGATADTVIGFTGAASNDPVILGLPAAIEPGIYGLGIASNGNVIVRVGNGSVGTITPASATWKVVLWRH